MEPLLLIGIILLFFLAARIVVGSKKPEKVYDIELKSISIFDNLGIKNTVDAYKDLTINQRSALSILREGDLVYFSKFVNSVKMTEEDIKKVKSLRREL